MKLYKTRKELLKDNSKGWDVTNWSLEELWDFFVLDDNRVFPVAVSTGTYGVNGGAFQVKSRDGESLAQFYITDRSSLLLALI